MIFWIIGYLFTVGLIDDEETENYPLLVKFLLFPLLIIFLWPLFLGLQLREIIQKDKGEIYGKNKR